MADVGPVLMDGAMGTLLWQLAQEAGVERKPVWTYNIDHPDLVRQAHRCYLEAGSELILANTFGANRLAVMRGEMQVSDVIRTGMRLAGETAGAYGARAALDLGPLTELLEPYGDLEAETCAGLYREMVDTGLEAGADCVVLETFMDLEMLRIAAEQALGRGVPVLCAMTFEAGGRTLMGNTVEQVAEALEPMGVAAVGVNCSLGPAQALPLLRRLRTCTRLPLLFKPNAGLPSALPGGLGESCTAEQFACEMAPALELAQYVGGCCGCDEAFIRALKEKLDRP